ncbi:MAG TPA: phytanoyl-CoA dioxygenase family protein, partial [Nitriliruptorales bacterium]
MSLVTTDHLHDLRRHGYAVLPDLVAPERVEILAKAAADHFPKWEDVVAGRDRTGVNDHGLAFRLFPYDADELNLLPFDERFVDLAEQAFDGQPVFLTQSLVRASYPLPSSSDQDLHRDYTNNGLLAPSDDPRYGQLAVLVYLTDVDLGTAPTYICSR